MELNSSEITKYIQIAKRNHKEGKLKEANQIYKNNYLIYYKIIYSFIFANTSFNFFIAAFIRVRI